MNQNKTGARSLRRVVNDLRFKAGGLGGKKGNRRGDLFMLESQKVGEKRIFKHKDGHVLASDKVLKAIHFKLIAFMLQGCEEVYSQTKLDYEIGKAQALDVDLLLERNSESANISSRKSMNSDAGSVAIAKKQNAPGAKLKKKEKGTAYAVIDNNQIALYKSTVERRKSSKGGTLKTGGAHGSISDLKLKASPNEVEPLKKFCWANIYSIDRQAGSPDFQLVFYNPLDEDEGCMKSKVFQFTVVTLKGKDIDETTELMQQIYKAIEGQAMMATSTAERLADPHISNPSQLDEAEDYMRLCVDLWSLSEGAVSQKSIEAIEKLITYLQGHEDPDNEAAFWIDEKNKLADELKALNSEGEAVEGIAL